MTPFKTYDRWLLMVTVALAGFGALMVYSTTAVVTPAHKAGTSSFRYFNRHLFTMALGAVAMATAYRVRRETLKKYAIPLLCLSLVLVALVFVPGIGVTAGKARRWIRLWPSTFQPSELVKLSMVIFLAKYLSESFRAEKFSSFAVPIAVMMVFQGMFLLQPDFGSTMTLFVLTVSMMIVAGARLKHILSLLLLAAPVVVKLLLEPYRVRRLVAFLDPWQNAQGSGFQLVQSFIALGSGGPTGVGLGNGKQKLQFLPEVHTDFIFSVVGEELGFFVAASVVALFALLFLRGMLIADKNSGEPFAQYLAFGLSMMIALQALINFFVVTGLVPTKGLPLPFISYGGSSLLMNMTAVGILLRLSRAEPVGRGTGDLLMEAMRKKKARRTVYGAVR